MRWLILCRLRSVGFGISQLRDPGAQEIPEFLILLAIVRFDAGLGAEGARANAKVPAERPAEVSGIAESPGESDLGDRLAAQGRVSQIIPALFQALCANAISQRSAGT